MHADPCDAIAAPPGPSTLAAALSSWLPIADPRAAEPGAAAGARRFWTLDRLVATLVLIAWGNGSEGLIDRFEAARACWPDVPRALTYQGFVKAWRQAGLRPLDEAAGRLRSRMAGAAEAARIGGWDALAADGSRFDLPRTAGHERVFGTAGKAGSGPQVWVTTLWHLGLGLPWAWKVGRADAGERRHLLAMLGHTPLNSGGRGTLLVMDAGFTGYELLRRIVASGRHALVRVGESVELIRDWGQVEHAADGVLLLWPQAARRRGEAPLALRLITLPLEGQRRRMDLLTTVLDPGALGDALAGELYRRRWGVELMYRDLKQTLEAGKLRARAPAQALLEVHGLLLGLTLLGLETRGAIAASGGDASRGSTAQALRVVRRGLRRPDQPRPWHAELGLALKDGYARRRKTRVAWPRKKRADKPPGRPKVRPARPEEREALARLAAA